MPHVLAKASRLARHSLGRLLRGARLATTSVAAFRREHPDRWYPAHPSQPVPPGEPCHWGAQRAAFPASPDPYPPLGLIDLSGGGAIVGLAGWGMSHDHRLLHDIGWPDLRSAPDRVPRMRYPTDRLAGQCLSIASDCAHENYGHFLLDSLPRLGLAQAAGFDPGGFDRIIAAPLPHGLPNWLLDCAGISPQQLAFVRMHRRTSAERLLATTFPGRPKDYPRSTVDYLRALYPDDGAPRRRRLFVRRFGVRELRNEGELIAIARRHGFEIFDFRDHADPSPHFAQARIVAGAHGATLANIVFCKPGTQVFEIAPSDHIEPYYMTLARAGDMPFHAMVGISESHRPAGAEGRSISRVSADPQVFEAALRHLVDADGSLA